MVRSDGPDGAVVDADVARRSGRPPDEAAGGSCAGPAISRGTMIPRIERLRADSAGRVQLSVQLSSPIRVVDLRLLDRVGARLTSALAGPVGGRITVCIAQERDDVVLDVATARPGSWARALQRVAFDDLVARLSDNIAERGGALLVGTRSHGRLHITVRLRAACDPQSLGRGRPGTARSR